MVERITSRKHPFVGRLRALAARAEERARLGELVCDGEKPLREALAAGAEVTGVLCCEGRVPPLPADVPCYAAPPELVAWASPLKNSPGPVFACVRRPVPLPARLRRAIVLEQVQDPGNVGTVIRTADALGVDAVLLTGACADPWGPKVVRATMASAFRQPVLAVPTEQLAAFLRKQGLPLYGAALSARAQDVRAVPLGAAAVAVGSEGSGLSDALLAMCDGQVIIPMAPGRDSLNAAVAASILMWEMVKDDGR